MKKILSLLIIFTLCFSFVSVSADEAYFESDGEIKLRGHVTGYNELTLVDDGSSNEYNSIAIYDLKIDINSLITFDTLVDTLFIHGENSDKDDRNNYDFSFDGVFEDDGTCTVNFVPGYRDDVTFYDQYESKADDVYCNVQYMQENATVRFNKAGKYNLIATLGSTTASGRISQLVKKYYEDRIFYAQPTVMLRVTVTSETHSEDIYDTNLYYDDKIVSVKGITSYDESRIVMGDFRVAVCSVPTVLTAETNLSHMAVVKLENINGQWVEKRCFDGFAINLGDTTKNWYPAEGFEDTFEDCYEFTGDENSFSEENLFVKKGTSVSFSEPGMYTLWADAANGGATSLTFEIKDSVASYTDSKVLVNGKDIKFEAYNINDNNYFKLRDIAYVLSEYGAGGSCFNVKWDGERNMINLLTNQKYDAVGGELKEGNGQNKPYETSSSTLLKDGINVSLNAYLINGNNYFKLRDLGKLFDFNVSWDGANNCILIDSTTSYME